MPAPKSRKSGRWEADTTRVDLIEHARAVESEITALADLGPSSRADAPSWDALLESVIRVSGCDGGFIGEIAMSEIGIESMHPRAHSLSSPLPDDSSLAVAQVIAGADFSIVDSSDGERRLITLPLVAGSRRVSGIVGLVGDPGRIDASMSQVLGPLVNVVAGIADSLGDSSSGSGRGFEDEVAFLASVVGSAAYGMVVVDDRGVVEIVNEAAQAMLGLHEIELLGGPLVGFLETSDLEWVTDLVEAGCHERVGLDRRTVTLLEGSEFAFRADLTVSLVPAAERCRAILMFRSVESELQAQAVAKRAADLLAITPDLVLWADDDGRVEYLNGGGRALLEVEDCSTMAVADVFPPWAIDSFDREIRPALYERGTWTGNLALLTSAGEEIPASITFLYRDEGPYLAVMARDLRSQQHLDMLQDAFVSTVSHELRTPLSAILGYLEMFADGDLGALSDEQRLGLEAMKRNGVRLRDLVDQLLQVASVGDSGLEERSPLDLGDVVSRLIGSQDGWSDRVGLVSAEEAVVLGSEPELTSLVVGLVENALKFSDADVEVRVSRIGPWIELVVEDHGVGIPAAELGRVFDRFFRASNARQLETPGAGLGLAIARAIVRKHGGEIAIDSELGAGTTTRVLLPATDTETRM